ncbi:MAG: hypothetical protein SFZ23_00925 [Planctomycetota bacterium]|nr:hypothetical protein [Planctomycetota bacterium]
MRGVPLLALRHLVHQRWASTIIVLCLTITLLLPAVAHVLTSSYEASLTSRAAATPLIAGSKGNRFDLTLSVLYFRKSGVEPVRMSDVEAIQAQNFGLAIPMHVAFTARGLPVVATTPEYFEHRNLRAARGELPVIMGEVALGARAARDLGVAPGDFVFSDQRELYQIAAAPALKMRVVGVLAPTDTPDDDAIFSDLRTAWVLEGLVHGHEDPKKLRPELVLGGTDSHTVLSEAMIEYNEITPENVGTFHVHGTSSELPVSAIMVVPANEKASTLIKAQVNASKTMQMVVPSDVVSDLIAFVFRIKALFDALAVLLAVTTALLTALVVALSLRLRAREIQTLHRIGCGRWTVFRLCAVELMAIGLVSCLLAAAGVAGAVASLSALPRML